MAKRSILGILILCIFSLVVVAQESPTLVQPGSAGLSPTQMTALQTAITRLQYVLNNGDLGCKKQLGSGGWTSAEFATYTAGTLERFGYQVAIVSRSTLDGGTSFWVVVRVDLGGAAAWIPVEPSPSGAIYQPNLGTVPLVSALIYNTNYLSYETVVELPANIPPIAAIRAAIVDVVEEKASAWFGNSSTDPDGEVVLYQWAFGDDVQRPTYTAAQWYTFEGGGMDYPVTLTVTDNRGVQASTTISVYVMTIEEDEADSCGCHNP